MRPGGTRAAGRAYRTNVGLGLPRKGVKPKRDRDEPGQHIAMWRAGPQPLPDGRCGSGGFLVLRLVGTYVSNGVRGGSSARSFLAVCCRMAPGPGAPDSVQAGQFGWPDSPQLNRQRWSSCLQQPGGANNGEQPARKPCTKLKVQTVSPSTHHEQASMRQLSKLPHNQAHQCRRRRRSTPWDRGRHAHRHGRHHGHHRARHVLETDRGGGERQADVS